MTLDPAWRVTAYDPQTNTAEIGHFTTQDDARNFAGILRARHPSWDIDILPIRATR